MALHRDNSHFSVHRAAHLVKRYGIIVPIMLTPCKLEWMSMVARLTAVALVAHYVSVVKLFYLARSSLELPLVDC